MGGDRQLRILARLRARGDKGPGEVARLCEVSAEIIGVGGAGIMLMSNDAPRVSICSSNEVSERIEDLQFTLGEGPCVDAYELDRPVLEPNLRRPVVPRWF